MTLCPNSVCPKALSQYHALTQGIRAIETFNEDKNATPRQTKIISQINHRYLESATHSLPIFQFFCCKIEIAEKMKWLFACRCNSNIILLLNFKKNNKFYCVQAAKIVKSKDVSCQRIKFRSR